MYETWTTLQGWVGTDVAVRDTPYGPVARFRLGCTPRYQKNGAWVDGDTSWFTVNCWRQLAGHVGQSVRQGDAVVVHGRLTLEEWSRDGAATPAVSAVVEATVVGHDLNRGSSRFLRASRPDRAEAGPEDPAREPGSGAGDRVRDGADEQAVAPPGDQPGDAPGDAPEDQPGDGSRSAA